MRLDFDGDGLQTAVIAVVSALPVAVAHPCRSAMMRVLVSVVVWLMILPLVVGCSRRAVGTHLASEEPMTRITLVGLYRVAVAEKELRFIAEEITGSMSKAKEEVSGLTLVEIEVRGAPADFDVARFRQPGSEQVAWAEKYLSLDGAAVLSDGSRKPAQSDFRVCFFLHRLDASQQIHSPYGSLGPAEVTEMPERLSRICVYEHPG